MRTQRTGQEVYVQITRTKTMFCVVDELMCQILLAPAGGKEWAETDPYADYYGPDGGPIDFDSPVDVSAY